MAYPQVHSFSPWPRMCYLALVSFLASNFLVLASSAVAIEIYIMYIIYTCSNHVYTSSNLVMSDETNTCIFLFLQVAHFYDTIDQEMIKSQQPMMLNSALAFERIIKDPKAGN